MPRAPGRRPPPRVRRRENRPTAPQRGYGSRWARYRKAFLARPENALCRRCEARGRVEPSTDVDHIQPVTGPDDPLFWEPSNHQGLCHGCHSQKTNTEDRGKGRCRRRR